MWEISIVAPSARDRLGYPTQKPEKLMERIILASSNPGDVVLDPFAGCGTTLVVAHELRRQWIGIDISPTAVGLVKRRMERVGATTVKLIGMPVTENELQALRPFEFQNWVIQQLDGTHSPRKSGDMGIDGYTWFEHLPVQVKQAHNVGRNVVDNFETAVERSGKHAGLIIAFSFTKGAFEEAARAKSEKGQLIELRTVATMLGDKTNIVTPERGLLMSDRPLPAPRPDDARPSVEQLVESSRATRPSELTPGEDED